MRVFPEFVLYTEHLLLTKCFVWRANIETLKLLISILHCNIQTEISDKSPKWELKSQNNK